MKYKLSERDRKYVEWIIAEICRKLKLHRFPADYQEIGWVSFLEVFHAHREKFFGTGKEGWKLAVQVIFERLSMEKRTEDILKYQTVSLDAPISPNVDTTRGELVRPKHGDFQSSVCFWDYINDLGHASKDAAVLARALANGDTIEEVRQDYGWGTYRTGAALKRTRRAMEEYLRI